MKKIDRAEHRGRDVLKKIRRKKRISMFIELIYLAFATALIVLLVVWLEMLLFANYMGY